MSHRSKYRRVGRKALPRELEVQYQHFLHGYAGVNPMAVAFKHYWLCKGDITKAIHYQYMKYRNDCLEPKYIKAAKLIKWTRKLPCRGQFRIGHNAKRWPEPIDHPYINRTFYAPVDLKPKPKCDWCNRSLEVYVDWVLVTKDDEQITKDHYAYVCRNKACYRQELLDYFQNLVPSSRPLNRPLKLLKHYQNNTEFYKKNSEAIKTILTVAFFQWKVQEKKREIKMGKEIYDSVCYQPDYDVYRAF